MQMKYIDLTEANLYKKFMRIKNIFILLSSLFLLIFSMAGCVSAHNGNDELRIVTSIAPIYSLTANIIEGSFARVDNLVPPGASEHSWQLKSSDAVNLEKADIILINGAGLETYLQDFLKDKKVAIVSEGIDLITITSEDITSTSGDGSTPNPHVWLDPDNAKIMAQNIAEILMKKDAKNAELYQRNTNLLVLKLDVLKQEMLNRFSMLDIRPFMEFHDAYPYFNKAFGLEPAAVIELVPGETPSPQYLKYLLDLMEKKAVRAIFTEPQLSPKILDLFREKYNFKTAELDPVGQELSKEGYFKMMQKNVEAFEQVFLTQS